MDRREFLKTAGGGAAALALASCTGSTGRGGDGNRHRLAAEGQMPQRAEGVGLLGPPSRERTAGSTSTNRRSTASWTTPSSMG